MHNQNIGSDVLCLVFGVSVVITINRDWGAIYKHEEGMEAVDLGGGLRIWYGEVREGIKYYNQTATFTTL